MQEHRAEGHVTFYKCWHRNSMENNDFCGCTHGRPEPPSFTFYAVVNDPDLTIAHWYCTYSQRKNSGWVKDFKDAKIWTRPGPAQGKCTNLGVGAFLVKFAAGHVEVIDQRARLERVAAEKRNKEMLRLQNAEQRRIVEAERALKTAQENLARLKKGNQ